MIIGSALLDSIEAAIKTSPWWLPNAHVLVLEGRREFLGVYGTRYHGNTNLEGDEIPLVDPVVNPGLAYSFTRRQCKAMRTNLRKQAKQLANPS